MTDIYKGTSGNNRYLVMTEHDARRSMNSQPNLKFYRCNLQGEFNEVLSGIPIVPKVELCHRLQIDAWSYDGFLRDQFKANILQMCVTDASHYTSPYNKLAEDNESALYLAPTIYGLEYYGDKFYNFTSNPETS